MKHSYSHAGAISHSLNPCIQKFPGRIAVYTRLRGESAYPQELISILLHKNLPLAEGTGWACQSPASSIDIRLPGSLELLSLPASAISLSLFRLTEPELASSLSSSQELLWSPQTLPHMQRHITRIDSKTHNFSSTKGMSIRKHWYHESLFIFHWPRRKIHARSWEYKV